MIQITVSGSRRCCTVIANVTSQGPKTMFPWEQKLEKCQTNYTKGTHIICGVSDKKIFWPRGSPWGTQSPESLCPWIQKLFFCSNPLNKVPVSLPNPQINFLGSNVDLFSNQEADFEVEIISPNGYVGSVLNIFLPKITHTID